MFLISFFVPSVSGYFRTRTHWPSQGTPSAVEVVSSPLHLVPLHNRTLTRFNSVPSGEGGRET